MRRQLLQFFGELTRIIVVSLLIVIPIRFFVMQPFFVKGSSMEPNFRDRQYLLVDEITYRFREPHRGDVIVFKYPKDPKQYYIKRVIGLPGERVVVQNNQVTIYDEDHPNGFSLTESGYLADGELTGGDTDMTLANDLFFVMGANREASYDSRRWGPLPEDLIIGRALVRVFPIDKAMAIEAPQYNY